jgi:hypothetical protein
MRRKSLALRMPNLRLGEVDVRSLIGYLKAAAQDGGHGKR